MRKLIFIISLLFLGFLIVLPFSRNVDAKDNVQAYESHDEEEGMYTFNSTWRTHLLPVDLAINDITHMRFFKLEDGADPAERFAKYTKVITDHNGIDVYQNDTQKGDLIFIAKEDIIAPTNCNHLFSDLPNLIFIEFQNFKIKDTTDMSYMFFNCPSLDVLSINEDTDPNTFNTGKVENMSYMFAGTSISKLELKIGFDTSSVKDMSYMFANSYIKEVDMHYFNTYSVKTMEGMFMNTQIEKINFPSNINTRNVENMAYMFAENQNITLLDLKNFDMSNVKTMEEMFSGSKIYTIIFGNNFDTSKVTNMRGLFYNCQSLLSVDLENLNTSSVIDMSYMFVGSHLSTINLSNFDTRNVETMSNMFSTTSVNSTLDLSSFDTSNVQDMSYMFGDNQFSEIIFGESFNTSKVKNMAAMFIASQAIKSLDLSGFNTSNVENMECMFQYCENLNTLDLSSFSSLKLKSMAFMFNNSALRTITFSNKFNASSVTNMRYAFSEMRIIKELDLTMFNPISVIDMSSMFTNSFALEEVKFPTTLNTRSLLDTSFMFEKCYGLKKVNISHLNTSNVTNMKNMFNFCESLVDLGNNNVLVFDTSSVEDMRMMFQSCISLDNIDISSFSSLSLLWTQSMFSNVASATSIVLGSSFDLRNVRDASDMFNQVRSIETLDLSYFDSNSLELADRMFANLHSMKEITFGPKFTLEKVTSASFMISSLYVVESLDISHFNFKVLAKANGFFSDNRKLKEISFGQAFDGTPLENIEVMFHDVKLKELDLSNWDLTNVRVALGAFGNMTELEYLKLTGFDNFSTQPFSRLFIDGYRYDIYRDETFTTGENFKVLDLSLCTFGEINPSKLPPAEKIFAPRTIGEYFNFSFAQLDDESVPEEVRNYYVISTASTNEKSEEISKEQLNTDGMPNIYYIRTYKATFDFSEVASNTEGLNIILRFRPGETINHTNPSLPTPEGKTLYAYTDDQGNIRHTMPSRNAILKPYYIESGINYFGNGEYKYDGEYHYIQVIYSGDNKLNVTWYIKVGNEFLLLDDNYDIIAQKGIVFNADKTSIGIRNVADSSIFKFEATVEGASDSLTKEDLIITITKADITVDKTIDEERFTYNGVSHEYLYDKKIPSFLEIDEYANNTYLNVADSYDNTGNYARVYFKIIDEKMAENYIINIDNINGRYYVNFKKVTVNKGVYQLPENLKEFIFRTEYNGMQQLCDIDHSLIPEEISINAYTRYFEEDSEVSYTPFSFVNVNTYFIDVSYILNNTSNTSNYSEISGSTFIEFTIAPKRILFPTSNTVLVYNTLEQAPAFNLNGFETYINYDENKEINAGDYKTVFSLKDSTNTTWINGKKEDFEVYWSINKILLESPKLESKTYDAKEKVIEGTLEYFVDGTNTFINAGTYKVNLKLSDFTNYAWKNSNTDTIKVDFVILKASINKPLKNDTVFTYDGLEKTYLEGDYPNLTILSNKQTNAGNYKVDVILSDKDNFMWDDNTQDDLSFDFIINKVAIKKPQANTERFVYDGTLKSYFKEEIENVTVRSNSYKEAGTYTVVVSLNDKVNFMWDDFSSNDLAFDFVIYDITFDWSSIVDSSGSVIENPGVNVIIPSGVLPDMKLVVEKLEAMNSHLDLSSLSKYSKNLGGYNIYITSNGEIVSLKEEIQVRINVIDDAKNKEYKLYNVINQSQAEVSTNLIENTLEFVSLGLGEFLFVYEEVNLLWLIIVLAVIIFIELILVLRKHSKNKQLKYENKMEKNALKAKSSIIPMFLISFFPSFGRGLSIILISIIAFLLVVYIIQHFRGRVLRSKQVDEEISKQDINLNITNINIDSNLDISKNEFDDDYDELLDLEGDLSYNLGPECNVNGFVVRYNKSFTAKLHQLNPDLGFMYSKIKNHILGYKNVRSRISWKNDTFMYKRATIVRVALRGKSLYLYLAITKDEADKCYITKQSDAKRYADTPYFLKVRGKVSLNRAIRAFDLLAKRIELIFESEGSDNYQLPYKNEEALINDGLIKVLNLKRKATLNSARIFVSDKKAIRSILFGDLQRIKGKKATVSLETIKANYNDNEVVDLASLKEHKLIKEKISYLKIKEAKITFDKALTVKADEYTLDAVKMIIHSGGKVIKNELE